MKRYIRNSRQSYTKSVKTYLHGNIEANKAKINPICNCCQLHIGLKREIKVANNFTTN